MDDIRPLQIIQEAFLNLYKTDIRTIPKKSNTELSRYLKVYGYIGHIELAMNQRFVGAFIGRDHATIHHYCQDLTFNLERDKHVKDVYDKIKTYIDENEQIIYNAAKNESIQKLIEQSHLKIKSEVNKVIIREHLLAFCTQFSITPTFISTYMKTLK